MVSGRASAPPACLSTESAPGSVLTPVTLVPLERGNARGVLSDPDVGSFFYAVTRSKPPASIREQQQSTTHARQPADSHQSRARDRGQRRPAGRAVDR